MKNPIALFVQNFSHLLVILITYFMKDRSTKKIVTDVIWPSITSLPPPSSQSKPPLVAVRFCSSCSSSSSSSSLSSSSYYSLIDDDVDAQEEEAVAFSISHRMQRLKDTLRVSSITIEAVYIRTLRCLALKEKESGRLSGNLQ